MLSKRTIIGFVIGSIIIGIGIVSLIQHIGPITVQEDHLIEVGGIQFYTIPAPASTPQSMKIVGDSFNVTLSSPSNGLQIPERAHKNEVVLDWVHLEDGETKIKIQNTGNSDLQITGTFGLLLI